jgi:hypothetical protein
MKRIQYLLILTSFLLSTNIYAIDLLRFSIQSSEKRINAPVSVSLDGINYNTDKGNLILYEIANGKETEIPCQVETGFSARIWFILKGVTAANTKKEFVLKMDSGTRS